MSRRLIASLVLLLLLPGCARGGGGPDKVEESVRRKEQRAIHVEIRGARTVTYDGRVDVETLSRKGEGEQAAFSVAVMTLVQPLAIQGGQLNLEVTIGGRYGGDGEYKLAAGSGPIVPTAGPTAPGRPLGGDAVSKVMLTFFEGTKEKRFGYALESCKIRFEDDATEGTARCPALVAFDGEKVSLELSWKP